jgi:segregation and condensation protein A
MTLETPENPAETARSLPPAVVFGEGRRPDATTTHVQMAEFQGPLGLLLALIEARQLDVLTVPLGALAEAYLDALASLEDDRLGNVSAFVAVASQLILIKSRAMLPRQAEVAPGTLPEDEPDPEAELRARLILYRAHRDAGLQLQAEALFRHGLFRREPAAAAAAGLAGVRPPDAPPLDAVLLVRALAGLVRIAPPIEPPPEVIRRAITLSERATFIRAAIDAAGASPIVLQELLRGVRDRVVAAVTFLAMLELMKRREIVVSQEVPWGPIVARATTPEEREGHGRSPAVEDEPIDESLASFS